MRYLIVLLMIMALSACTSVGAEVESSPTSEMTATTAATEVLPVTETPSPTETATLTPSPLPTAIPEWKPGWLIYQDEDDPYSIAYPRTWTVTVDQWRAGDVKFQSPETGTPIFVTVFTAGIGDDPAELVTWATDNRDRVLPFHLDATQRPPEPEINTRFLNRDAIFFFSTGRPTLGTQASMLVAEGDDVYGNVYRIYLHGADWLEAEGAIYRAMLNSFTLNGEQDSEYTMPDGMWIDHYEPVSEIEAIVSQVIPEEQKIVLRAPMWGFVTVTLEPNGTLVNSNGDAITFDEVLAGVTFQAEGQAGEAGDYRAQSIIVETSR